MDTATGEVRQFESDEELRAAQRVRARRGIPPLMPVKNWPAKASCRKCHGRGHVGKDVRTGLFVPCRCVL